MRNLTTTSPQERISEISSGMNESSTSTLHRTTPSQPNLSVSKPKCEPPFQLSVEKNRQNRTWNKEVTAVFRPCPPRNQFLTTGTAEVNKVVEKLTKNRDGDPACLSLSSLSGIYHNRLLSNNDSLTIEEGVEASKNMSFCVLK